MSHAPTFVFENASIHMKVDLRVYRLAAVKKAAYRLADRCTAVIGEIGDGVLPISLVLDAGTTEAAATTAARLFLRELLDQELREHIAEETAPMRALILAHAFSRTNLVEGR